MRGKILYICVSFDKDRLLNVLYFAKELGKKGYLNYFLTLPYGVPFFKDVNISFEKLTYSKDENYRIFKEFCLNVKPDYILLADGALFDFWFGPAELFKIDWIIDNPSQAHFASFDYLGLANREHTFFIANSPQIEEKFKTIHLRDLTKVMPILIACPLGFPGDYYAEPENVFYYRRPDNFLSWSDGYKEIFKINLGVKENDKLAVVYLDTGSLQISAATTENQEKLLNCFCRTMEKIFSGLQHKITLTVLTNYPVTLNIIPEKAHIILLDTLTIDMYFKFLTAADIFISSNAVSGFITQAILSSVPCAVIADSDEISTAVFQNNPVTDIINFLNITQPEKAITTINNILFDSGEKEFFLKRAENYRGKINSLLSPEKIITQIGERSRMQ